MKIVNNLIKAMANKWFNFFAREVEIEVFQKCDRQGNNYWLAFNPINRSYNYFGSEAEVRMWIEQSYYNH